MRARTFLGLSLAAVIGGIGAEAHHSFGAFYFEDQTVTLEGAITEFRYINPHVWVIVEARDLDGVLRTVSAEWSNPGRLNQQGIQRTTLKPGDRVIISGSPSRDSSAALHLKGIERPADGWRWVGRGERR